MERDFCGSRAPPKERLRGSFSEVRGAQLEEAVQRCLVNSKQLMKKRCPPTIKLQGRLVLNAGPKEPRLRPSIVLCHEVIHEWLFLKFSCRRQKARKMGHCVQSLASDLKP